MTWLGNFFGLNGSGTGYSFWSGVGSDLGEIALIGMVWQLYRARNCHVRGCWRLQWRKVPGTDHTVCRKHHPHEAPTHQDVLDDHRAANA